VTLVAAFLRAHRSVAVPVHARRCVQRVRLIQAEFRGYLALTQSNRTVVRQRREVRNQRFLEGVSRIVDRTRDTGRAVCAEEAVGRRVIAQHFMSIQRAGVGAATASAFTALVDEEATAFDELCRETPAILVPGSPANMELRGRNHIVRLRTAEVRQFEQRALQHRAALMTRDMAQRHEQLSVDEMAERVAVARQRAGAFARARLGEVEGTEQRLRALAAEQRLVYVSGLSRRRALLTGSVMVASTDKASEPMRRLAAEAAERQAFCDMRIQFERSRTELALFDIGSEERDRRRGFFGIAKQEEEERRRIMAAIWALRLQLLQNDDITDVLTECGARTAIRWLEQREFYAATRRIAQSLESGMVPVEEEASRDRVAREERAHRVRLRGATLNTMTALAESGARRGIFVEWCRETTALMFLFARLRLLSGEEAQRELYTRLATLGAEHHASAEFLQYLEGKERDLVVAGCLRAEQRFLRLAHSDPRTLLPR
jgi:hypothetical protein